MLRLCGIAVLGAVVAMLLGELGFKGRRLISLLVIITLLLAVGDGLSQVVGAVTDFGNVAGIGETVRVALKVILVGYLFGISADLCSELGEGGLANALTLCGRVETFVLVLPQFREILRLGMELVK